VSRTGRAVYVTVRTGSPASLYPTAPEAPDSCRRSGGVGSTTRRGGREMITCYAFRAVPPFAQGLVRDLRLRWALEEVGLPYRNTLVGDGAMPRSAYRKIQPFGQIPAIEDGNLVLFESGATVLHIAERFPACCPMTRRVVRTRRSGCSPPSTRSRVAPAARRDRSVPRRAALGHGAPPSGRRCGADAARGELAASRYGGGERKASVFRGRWLSCSAVRFSSACELAARSVPFGKYFPSGSTDGGGDSCFSFDRLLRACVGHRAQDKQQRCGCHGGAT
jgi:hypothetical protein